ncbi:MAG: hypothetical protein E6G34_01030 [Actinobacteria bacterium]|nr:MAG: hypothetical protein E6G34_01030 [Actinomycetota bacterium]
MSGRSPRLFVSPAGVHPAVLDRRVRELALLAVSALVPLALALAVSLEVPKPNLLLALAAIVGALGVVALVVSTRLEVTVTLLVVYLGLLDGPIKLGVGGYGSAASAVRNVLIFAVALGALLRLLVKRERVRLPPLSGWVLAFAGVVVLEAFNPRTHGLLHVLGGYRQQLQWVPFFFFGYAVMRSKVRFRQLFLVLGVIALANAGVATYQSRLSPAQLASWGPGYSERVFPAANGVGGGARIYVSEGEARVRPLALGSDEGFSGGTGLIALPGALALVAIARRRQRWIAVVFSLGALIGVAVGAGRLQLVGAGIAAVSFALLSSLAGRNASRTLAALLAVVALAIPAGVVLASAAGNGTFKRYESVSFSSSSYKAQLWKNIPHVLSQAPFGVGLGTVGSASRFGGKVSELLPEGRGVTGETQYNLLADETGAPGLVIWVGLALSVMLLAVRRLRYIADPELRLAVAGVAAPVFALLLMGFSGYLGASAALGPYYWFAAGVASYWLTGASGTSGAVVRSRHESA